MKKLFLFSLLTLSFTLLSTTSVEISKKESNKSEIIHSRNEVNQNWYSTTGQTRNTYGENYSISVRVQGSEGYSGCVNISTVQVSSGGGWSSVSYSSVYGEDCTYYFSAGSNTYYFKFK